jgi:uncharacterized LabA/DUF88 family protein
MARRLGRRLDYGRLLASLCEVRGIASPPREQCFYYNSLLAGDERSLESVLERVREAGFTMRIREAHTFVQATGRRVVRGSIDAALAVDAMTVSGRALPPRVDELILVSGSASFSALSRPLRQQGIHFTVASTRATSDLVPAPFVARELEESADTFLDLAHVPSLWMDETPDRARGREVA